MGKLGTYHDTSCPRWAEGLGFASSPEFVPGDYKALAQRSPLSGDDASKELANVFSACRLLSKSSLLFPRLTRSAPLLYRSSVRLLSPSVYYVQEPAS
jgi:hypothetical protein